MNWRADSSNKLFYSLSLMLFAKSKESIHKHLIGLGWTKTGSPLCHLSAAAAATRHRHIRILIHVPWTRTEREREIEVEGLRMRHGAPAAAKEEQDPAHE